MKFIKLFESFDEIYLELEEMCLGTIAYITDDIEDFKFQIKKIYDIKKGSEVYEILFYRNPFTGSIGYKFFEWGQVSDRIIHLLTLLENDYDEVPSYLLKQNISITGYTLDDYTDMILDNIKEDAKVKLIRIIIKPKK
jgi:Fe-S oxidoreductase